MENGANSQKETVFFGTFKRFLWRNERNGASFFLIATKQLLLRQEMYSKKEMKKNRKNEDETWFTISCDGTRCHTPFFHYGTPVMIKGYFNTQVNSAYGWDFVISEIKEASFDETTTIEYLASGSFPGISYESAVKIVGSFGSDVFTFVSQDASAIKRIVKATDLPEKVVSRMVKIIQTTVAERELFGVLNPLGISYAAAAKAIKIYAGNALKVLKNAPYKAGRRIGLNFDECDKLAKYFGLRSSDDRRLNAAVYEATERLAQEGHVWYEQKEFYDKVNMILRTDSFKERISASMIVTATQKHMTGFRYKGKQCFYNNGLYKSEQNIAAHIRRLSASPERNPYSDALITYAEQACGMSYGKQQREAFPNLLSTKGVKILTGGPGTGKTTTVKGLILGYQRMYPDHKVRLCAPTGRAAQRMSESTGMPSVTVHRLCEYKPFGIDSISYKDASDPIDADLIVCDEVSMMTIELMEILLGAIKSGASLWLIGDIHQLESVGAGAILRDCLAAPMTLIARQMLTEVFRQKGGSPIIENAIRINNGKTKLETCDDFQIINTKSEDESLEVVKKLCMELHNPDNPFETQILCPARKGVSGIDNCNIILQEMLNPAKKGQYMTFGKTQFRVNDKIIMTNNNYDETCQYFNGDIGVVKRIDEKGLVVDIRDEELLLERSSLEDIKLSYGMTIHKSQGSEFPYVIVVMPMNPSNMLVRNLLYTAVTRAKKKVYIINEGSAMQTAIKVDNSGVRRTTLAELLVK